MNIQGQMDNVRRVWEGTEWSDVWIDSGLTVEHFADVGLRHDSPDTEVWRLCQAEGLLLVTANRNQRGPDSLEAVIRAENTEDCLPVVTIGDQQALLVDTEYVYRVAVRILEIAWDIEKLRGVGRLYAP